MPCARFSPQRRWNGWAYSILRVSQDENLQDLSVRGSCRQTIGGLRLSKVHLLSFELSRQPTSRTSLQKSILNPRHFSNNSEPTILKPKQNHEIHLASILL